MRCDTSGPTRVAPVEWIESVLVPPTFRYYQGGYRDAATPCTSSTFNQRDGVRLLWVCDERAIERDLYG